MSQPCSQCSSTDEVRARPVPEGIQPRPLCPPCQAEFDEYVAELAKSAARQLEQMERQLDNLRL